MMKQTPSDTRISYWESPAYVINRALQEKGYQIANCAGIKVDEPSHDHIGILEPRAPVSRNFLGIKWHERQRALYLGTLWLTNPAIGASEEQWVLEVYGRDNVPKLTELVRELSEPFHVKVEVKLEKESPKLERYFVSDKVNAAVRIP
ncbi:MAG: hypothetical protein V1802_02695 [Candidatus Aenigmatarchaeota archaeon]